MRNAMTGLAAAASLTLGGCGDKTLTLPADPVDRAATCGVVTAIEARLATPNVKAPLALEAQGRILHHALLAGAEGGEFSADRAAAVSRRMTELQEDIAGGKWEELKPACAAAYPETRLAQVELPQGRLDAQLGCDELADFLATALGSQEADYGREIGSYHDLQQKLDQVMGPALRQRVGAGLEGQQKLRREALARISKAGPPMLVMGRCIERFG